jgi:hypothetical protein
MVSWNSFKGWLKMMRDFSIKGQEQVDGTRKDTKYEGHYVFVI